MIACHSDRPGWSRSRSWILVLALAFGLGASGANAQTTGFWKTYLNGNQVNALTGAGGDVWAATSGGAVRLAADGTFTQWNRASQGLLSDSCSAVAVDHSGHIWFGTQVAGISELDPQSGHWTDFTSLTEGIPNDQIQRIRFAGTAQSETLLVGTTQGFAIFVNGERRDGCQGGIDVCGPLNVDVRDLLFYGDSLWLATAKGVTVRSQARNTWIDHSAGIGALPLEGLAVADSLYAVGQAGIWVWRNSAWEQRGGNSGLPSGFHPLDVLGSGDTLYVAGTANSGAAGGVYRRVGGVWSRLGGAVPTITSIGHAPGGPLLAGAADIFEASDGIYLLKGSTWTRQHLPGPSAREKYLSLAFDANEDLWLSSAQKSVPPMVSRYSSGAWSLFPGGENGRSNQWTFKILTMGSALYLGHCCCTEGVDSLCGMELSPDLGNTFRRLARYSDVMDLALDNRGFIWAATQNAATPRQKGLFRISPTDTSSYIQATVETNLAHHSHLISDDLACVRVTGRVVWIGYYQDGVSRWDFGPDNQPFTGDDQWTHFQAGVSDTTLLNNSVDCLEIAPDGKVWIGTGEGLSIYDGVTFYNIAAGVGALPSSKVNAIIPTSEGGAWVATENGGLTRMLPAQYGYSYDVYGPPDLPNPNVASMTFGPDGKTLWLATDRGLASFFLPQAATPAAAGKVACYPNPFRQNCTLDTGIKLLNAGGVSSGVIIDVSGKVVGRFNNRTADQSIWNGRMGGIDGAGGGAKVTPGLYWIRANSPTGMHSVGLAVMDAACGM